MPVGLYDINSASIGQEYDFIVSTVVLMFLQADRIPEIIKNMQEQTTVGGYNLIVCAMDTEDYPCSVNFPFTFKEGELADYYKDWELVKYNENPGHLHLPSLWRSGPFASRTKCPNPFCPQIPKRL